MCLIVMVKRVQAAADRILTDNHIFTTIDLQLVRIIFEFNLIWLIGLLQSQPHANVVVRKPRKRLGTITLNEHAFNVCWRRSTQCGSFCLCAPNCCASKPCADG